MKLTAMAVALALGTLTVSISTVTRAKRIAAPRNLTVAQAPAGRTLSWDYDFSRIPSCGTLVTNCISEFRVGVRVDGVDTALVSVPAATNVSGPMSVTVPLPAAEVGLTTFTVQAVAKDRKGNILPGAIAAIDDLFAPAAPTNLVVR